MKNRDTINNSCIENQNTESGYELEMNDKLKQKLTQMFGTTRMI